MNADIRECRTCENLFLRYVEADRRMERRCVRRYPSREVELGDTCDGWSVRRDPFEHEEGDER